MALLFRKKRIIIGIHGIGNKPPQPLLRHWWYQAICEGLERYKSKPQKFRFELVYWAHYLYSEPLNIKEQNPENALYVDDPYVPAKSFKPGRHPGPFRRKALAVVELIMDRIFMTKNHLFNFDRIGEYVIRKKFRDLELYYNSMNVGLAEVGIYARNLIRNELATTLKKHRKKEILLISHSMGTIIAYDVLMQLPPDIRIHTLVTLGSPLGLPTIMKKIYTEQGRDFHTEKRLPTPKNIGHAWLNFSDLSDHIALNYSLADDFAPNSSGVAPHDSVVVNDYERDGQPNHHKSFGYLRTPEVADVIHTFLAGEDPRMLDRFRMFIQQIVPTIPTTKKQEQTIDKQESDKNKKKGNKQNIKFIEAGRC